MNCKMRTLIVVAIVFALGWCLSAFADADRGDRGFWGVGNLEKSWNRMSKYEKCIAAIMIPPGYVIGICSKGFAFCPFGKKLVPSPTAGAGTAFLNLIWIVFAGFWLALGSAITGVLWCCTIIGIPLGIACFNIAQASFAPLGKIVVKK